MSQKSFDQKYFLTIYNKDDTIDGDFNAKEHAHYLKSLFELQGYHPTRIFDYGFGKGTLLKEVSKKLGATYVGGCDVSLYAYDKLKKKNWTQGWKLKVGNIYEMPIPKKPYHLGLCNSVLQYLKKDEIKKAIDLMSKSCHYVYLHVPTKEDYKILRSDLKFEDAYAYQYPDKFYKALLKEHFHFVGWGLLESKKFHQHKNSIFTDSIYRF